MLIFAFLMAGIVQAQVVLPPPAETFFMHGHIAAATPQTTPTFAKGYLVFPYRGQQIPHRFVGIAFDYEGYERIHAFVKNKKGTYVFYGKLPENIKEFRYRLVVDSVWQHDTANPNIEYDELGVSLSKFVVETTPLRDEALGPVLHENGEVDFFLRGKPRMHAYLMGSFNQWDPFMTPMQEVAPGLYKVTLPLKPGRYYYNFLFNGQRIRDPYNFFQATGPGGEMVSVFDVDDLASRNISHYQANFFQKKPKKK